MSDRNIQFTHKARILERTKRIVVKVGSSVLSDGDGVHAPRISQLATTLSALPQAEVVLGHFGSRCCRNGHPQYETAPEDDTGETGGSRHWTDYAHGAV